jgi:hypothetical protein
MGSIVDLDSLAVFPCNGDELDFENFRWFGSKVETTRRSSQLPDHDVLLPPIFAISV